MSLQNSYVAIMAGGAGASFWPESRIHHPKQFLNLLNTGKSLVQWTYERFLKILPAENIFVITNQQYIHLLKEQLPELSAEQMLIEPNRKNTATCATYFAYKMQAKNPDATIMMAPCDHIILDEAAFASSCIQAFDFVSNHNNLLTIGVKPTKPEICYGYIQYHTTKKLEDSAYVVRTFTEKPSEDLAQTFIDSGDFLWNSGIFFWNAQTLIRSVAQHLPEMHEEFSANPEIYNTPEEAKFIQEIYPRCPNVSIDNGILEKAENVLVMQAPFGWSDLGSWNAVHEHTEKDYFGNTVKGKNVFVVDANECVVRVPDEKLVILQGLENFIVVDSNDVLLICSRDQEHHIREYIADIKRNKGDKFL